MNSTENVAPPIVRLDRDGLPVRRPLFQVAVGSIVIGVTLPCLLVGLRMLRYPEPHWLGVAMIVLLAALIACGSGAVVLSLILFKSLLRRAGTASLHRSVITGGYSGVAIAFVNLPGYLAAVVMQEDTFIWLRLALLFIVAGSSCGMWIGWQVWRTWHPGARLQVSLGTLILMVFLWGAAMFAFQPREWPPHIMH